ncbi:uncharacterized protein [Montipora capricornis]|uniref:uncharacterized protein isoform X3 n=1 Tax=Montipora capricornis TaxID=246305 RepID=UPI0035F1BF1C
MEFVRNKMNASVCAMFFSDGIVISVTLQDAKKGISLGYKTQALEHQLGTLSTEINKLTQIKSSQMLVFEEREKLEYPEKTSRCRVENQQTQPKYDAESPGPHLWEASALRTMPTLNPK